MMRFKQIQQLLKHIGKQIKSYRRERGLTQQQLADLLGVSWEMISRYERGENLTIHRLLQISDALGIDYTKFFDSISPTLLKEKEAYDVLVDEETGSGPVLYVQSLPGTWDAAIEYLRRESELLPGGVNSNSRFLVFIEDIAQSLDASSFIRAPVTKVALLVSVPYKLLEESRNETITASVTVKRGVPVLAFDKRSKQWLIEGGNGVDVSSNLRILGDVIKLVCSFTR